MKSSSNGEKLRRLGVHSGCLPQGWDIDRAGLKDLPFLCSLGKALVPLLTYLLLEIVSNMLIMEEFGRQSWKWGSDLEKDKVLPNHPLLQTQIVFKTP